MDKVIRYTAEDALASGEPGFWVRACDFDERHDQSKQREDALQGRLTEAEDIDSDLVVIVAVLGQRNAALEELLHDLVPLLESPDSPLFWEETMLERIHALTKPTAEACQLPQSCTTRCDCDIPDFSPGNGNRARRRAEALNASAFTDAKEPPCTACFARGCNGECSGDGAMGD